MMDKYTNEKGSEYYFGTKQDSPFSADLFHTIEHKGLDEYDDQNQQWALHTNIGSLTVVDRMTGFGFRDTETGFRDPDGGFWLATGQKDVRRSGARTVGEAIQWVKDRADIRNDLARASEQSEEQGK
jgi:hypothetical protein